MAQGYRPDSLLFRQSTCHTERALGIDSPVIGIPKVGYSSELWARKLGKRMKVEKIHAASQWIDSDLLTGVLE